MLSPLGIRILIIVSKASFDTKVIKNLKLLYYKVLHECEEKPKPMVTRYKNIENVMF